MQILLPKLREADIWVLASPVYFDGVTGLMKNLMDRMLPLLYPLYELRGGHYRHPLREGVKRGKGVLVSSCGFWEVDGFDPLLVHLKAFCKNVDREFAGALLRSYGRGLRGAVKRGLPLEDIFEAAKEAGWQLVQRGVMLNESLKTVARELGSQDVLLQEDNPLIQKKLDELEKK